MYTVQSCTVRRKTFAWLGGVLSYTIEASVPGLKKIMLFSMAAITKSVKEEYMTGRLFMSCLVVDGFMQFWTIVYALETSSPAYTVTIPSKKKHSIR